MPTGFQDTGDAALSQQHVSHDFPIGQHRDDDAALLKGRWVQRARDGRGCDTIWVLVDELGGGGRVGIVDDELAAFLGQTCGHGVARVSETYVPDGCRRHAGPCQEIA